MKKMKTVMMLLMACVMNSKAQEKIETGVFEPTWESLSQNYQAPEWFADAKLGIWAHWGIQCVPEAGDWYARSMYQQEQGKYREHVKKYGHPSEFGMKDFIPMWKAEKFNPDELVSLYRSVGARYFVCMANHRDKGIRQEVSADERQKSEERPYARHVPEGHLQADERESHHNNA